jgi:regulator of replication initiation timing
MQEVKLLNRKIFSLQQEKESFLEENSKLKACNLKQRLSLLLKQNNPAAEDSDLEDEIPQISQDYLQNLIRLQFDSYLAIIDDQSSDDQELPDQNRPEILHYFDD